jgi:hypothetical protein
MCLPLVRWYLFSVIAATSPRQLPASAGIVTSGSDTEAFGNRSAKSPPSVRLEECSQVGKGLARGSFRPNFSHSLTGGLPSADGPRRSGRAAG